jgi:hypothetical protein
MLLHALYLSLEVIGAQRTIIMRPHEPTPGSLYSPKTRGKLALVQRVERRHV